MVNLTPKQPPHPGTLIKLIRQLARDGKISWSKHARDERMNERNLDIFDALEVIRIGDIDGAIVPGKKSGEWRCVVVGRLRWTAREAGVVTVVIRDERIIVATVEWMDP